MSRRLSALDRLVVLLFALALGAAAFAALDWRYGWVLSWQDSLDLGPTLDVVSASWFPWAAAGAGILLGLLGLWWLTAHLRRPHVSRLRLRGSAPEGRVELDLGSLADAVADRFAELAPTDGVRGRSLTLGSHQVIELRVRISPGADGPALSRAARTCTDEVRGALPDAEASVRVLIDRPGRRGGSRQTTARVQ